MILRLPNGQTYEGSPEACTKIAKLYRDSMPTASALDAIPATGHTAEVCGHLSGRFTKLRCKLAPNHKPFPHQCGAFTWVGDPHEGAENRFHRAGCDRLTIADDRARFHFGAE